MSFVKRVVGPDEKLIGIARLHWIYGAKGLTWLVGFILVGGFLDTLFTSFFGSVGVASALPGFILIGNTIFWICLTIGACLFIMYFLMMIAAEIGLTTKRLIYKKGLIFVDVKEVDLEEIKGADVDNEILGRFFNYGSVHLDSRFVRDMILPSIADPYRFLKALNEARSQLKDESMHVILDGHHTTQHVGEALQQELDDHQQQTPQQNTPPKKPKQQPRPANATKEEEEGTVPHLHDKKYESFSENPVKEMGDVMDEAAESTDDVLHHYDKQQEELKKTENLEHLKEKGQELEQNFEQSVTRH